MCFNVVCKNCYCKYYASLEAKFVGTDNDNLLSAGNCKIILQLLFLLLILHCATKLQ